MIKIIFVLAAVLGVNFAIPVVLEVVRDEDGQEFALLPIDGDTILSVDELHQRVRRQAVTVGAEPGQFGGTRVTADVAGTLLNSNGHRLDGNANWARTYKQPDVGTGPVTLGGGLNYMHDKGFASIDAARTRGYGTDVSAQAGANLWRSPDRRTSLDASANYGRHFGGPGGTGRPNYGGLLNFSHRF